MEQFTLERDEQRPLKFTGELIASASSSADSVRGNYSGSTGRWTELKLYRTQAGKYVCQEIGFSQWEGEHTRYQAHVADTHDQIVTFFGTGWLAKELYDDAEIDISEEID